MKRREFITLLGGGITTCPTSVNSRSRAVRKIAATPCDENFQWAAVSPE
jgi:hypothetical protein